MFTSHQSPPRRGLHVTAAVCVGNAEKPLNERSRKEKQTICHVALSSTRLTNELLFFVRRTLAALKCPTWSLSRSILSLPATLRCTADLLVYSRRAASLTILKAAHIEQLLARSANETRDGELLAVMPSVKPGTRLILLSSWKCFKKGCHLNFVRPRLATPILKLTSLVLSSTGSTVPLLCQSTIYSTSSIKC